MEITRAHEKRNLVDVEWWEIQKRKTRGGRTIYDVSVLGERIVRGRRSMTEAINATLAMLEAREVVAS